jgi:hypothetical protein
MPHVWTDSQGTIHSACPIGKPSRPSNPFRLFALVSATSVNSARTLLRVSFRTSIRRMMADSSCFIDELPCCGCTCRGHGRSCSRLLSPTPTTVRTATRSGRHHQRPFLKALDQRLNRYGRSRRRYRNRTGYVLTGSGHFFSCVRR